MMCYRDMTFCSDATACVNAQGCGREFNDVHEEDANKWANGLGLGFTPVAFASFKSKCDKYKPNDAN